MNRGTLRLAYVLLGLMTVVSFGGPFLIGSSLRGGASTTWPPDRPIEWVAVVGLAGAVVAILIGLSALWLVHIQQIRAASGRRADAERGGS